MSASDNPKRGLRRQRIVVNSLDQVSHHSNNPDTIQIRLPAVLEDTVRLDLIDYDIPYAPLIIMEYIAPNQGSAPSEWTTLNVLQTIYERERTATVTPAFISVQYELTDGTEVATELSVVDVITDTRYNEGVGTDFDDPGNLTYMAQLIVTGDLLVTHLNDRNIHINIALGTVEEDGELGEGVDNRFWLTSSESSGDVVFVNYFNKPFVINVDVGQAEPWQVSFRRRAIDVAQDDIFFRNDVISLDGQQSTSIATRTAIFDQDFGTAFLASFVPLNVQPSSAISRETFAIIRPTEVTNLTRLRPDRDALMPVSYSFLPTDVRTIDIAFRRISGGDFYFPFDVRAGVGSVQPGRENNARRVYQDWSLTFDLWYYDSTYTSSISDRVPLPAT